MLYHCRWFSLFFLPAVHPALVHSVLKLLAVLLLQSPTFLARFRARHGFEALRAQLVRVHPTPQLYALLLAMLFGTPVDAVLRQGYA